MYKHCRVLEGISVHRSSGRGGWHLDYNDNGTDLSDGYSGYSDDYNSDESEDTFQPLLENNGYNRTNIPNISNRIEEIIHHSFWRTPLEQSFRYLLDFEMTLIVN